MAAIVAAAQSPTFLGYVRWHQTRAAQPELRMTVFYWAMAVIILGTFLPSVMYLVLYATTGERACMDRARVLWNISRVFTLGGANLLIWGHVAVGLWRIKFGG